MAITIDELSELAVQDDFNDGDAEVFVVIEGDWYPVVGLTYQEHNGRIVVKCGEPE